MRGMIQDILRCSFHDGPGIRTTVFFKGCPLHCVWCHNPETHRGGRQLRFFKDKCVRCGVCANTCIANVHRVDEKDHRIEWSRCYACGSCVAQCCEEALEIVGQEMDCEEVMEEIKKDLSFYGTEGGVTFSGGEPLLHTEFLLELAKQCKHEGIGTAIETCGCVSKESIAKVLPWIDVVLFDYKLDTQEAHDTYTGGNHRLIMENLNYIITHHKQVMLRCPIIPGINDTKYHFQEIAALSQSSPYICETKLMPYHNTGNCKWEQIGLTPKTGKDILQLKTVEEKEKQIWIQTIRKLGGVGIC